VLAGTLAALGIHLLLTALGMGAGLAPFRPLMDPAPVALFSKGAALAWSLFAIIALSLGGWVAGRLAGCPKCGLVQGVLVWCLTLILTLPLLALGTSLAMARVMKNPVKLPPPGGPAMVVAQHELAQQVTKRNEAQLCSFIEEAVQSIPTNAEPKADTRAEREVGLAVTTLYEPGNAGAFAANRREAINALMVYTGMSAADATITLDAWTASHQKLQVELTKLTVAMNDLKVATEQNDQARAETAAKAKADEAAQHLSWAASRAFFALLIGLLGAALGGRCGAECASRQADLPRTPATKG
jgi:hypothetical protein